MQLAGVVDVVTDWRPKVALSRGMALFGAAPEHAQAMRQAGLEVAGTLEDVLGQVDVVVDCPPKRIAGQNVETYRKRGTFTKHRTGRWPPAVDRGSGPSVRWPGELAHEPTLNGSRAPERRTVDDHGRRPCLTLNRSFLPQ